MTDIAPSADGTEAARALDELFTRITKGESITRYVERDVDWTAVQEGQWDRLGVPEDEGGFGLSLRDLVAVAAVIGAHAVPLALTTTLALRSLAPGEEPVTVVVPRRTRPDRGRVPFGHSATPIGSGKVSGEPDEFAPTLDVVVTAEPATELTAETRHHLATLWAAECTGAARVLVKGARDYALRRTQFGRPLGAFQAVKHLLADATLALAEADTALVIAANNSDASAIRWAQARCVLASEIATQAYGGIGITWELGAHLRTRHILMLRDLTEDLLTTRKP
ncbi:alkylation response protein AidB-like acyl-CoA dehydrogenase [Amycolatopsis bartoniae]|uniref:Acyl-CoA dehydrogenase/oxidase C-terminal domain-containing protein n=1 Tax=Amycolatopsis bartoniae TaxID=941986 RepID=A0A8H9MA86_9PSEU|nr:acyl-CoA dehydrogenase family protein [Amycolatopsis bartoniae]MBB2940241.1 alkylation response protein AidB-like acyl-CoA dehydrogenase [Amycolatopsis bartoniae]TVT10197.1 acyl-CoA dehydrogenase [Amycolatopsis bartoniae]GHF34937.1 hypothetical protein GCM10017566_04560 [Amycolatopsis bartoniae]